MWVYIREDGSYIPNANTLFYVTNDWEITDHSQYNHTMSWLWTSSYTTLSTWVKVADFDGTNLIYSSTFNEANNSTTFTMHCWYKAKSDTTEATFAWWMWRNQDSSSTTDRWWAKWQRDSWTSNWYVIYWPSSSSRASNTSVAITQDTSKFELYTFTINGWTVVVYKNAVQVGTRSWATIRWWSSTWTSISLWWYRAYDGSTWQIAPCYLWEFILENKVQTLGEIQSYFNNNKSLYWIS